MINDMEIVSLTEDLLSEAEELEKNCFSMPWSRESLLREINNPNCRYIAALEDGRLIAYAGLQTVLDEGYINNIATLPEHRRRGVASRLLENLIEFGKKAALTFLTLEVRASNSAAIAMYSKFGFKEVGLRRGYYEKPREDALLMTVYLSNEP